MNTCVSRETVQIIENLNVEIFDKLGEKVHGNYPFEFYLSTNGLCEIVEFLGHQIWNSEDDERKYVNENTPAEDYEPLEDFLRREASKICKMIGKLDFEQPEDEQ